MLDKRQIQAIFLSEFKMGCKTAETTHIINNAFGPGTANQHTVQWWFKKFCKGTKALKMRSAVTGHQKLRVTNWEDHQGWKCYLLSCVWVFVDPVDCSLPGSSVHGVLQTRILEWVVIPFSRGSSQPRDQTWVSCIAGRFFNIWATSVLFIHKQNQLLHSSPV